MTIAFNTIGLDLRVPGSYIELDASRARQGLPVKTPRALILGQSALLPGVLTRIYSVADGATKYGRTTPLANMIAAFMGANTSAEVWAISLTDDAAGTVATGAVTLTGTATAGGTLALCIGGRDVPIGVVAGDTPTAVAAKIVTAVNAGVTGLPISAANVAGVVTITAVNKGTVGNGIDIRVSPEPTDAIPAGVTVGVTAMSGGATDPVVTAALAAIGDEPFDAIVTGLGNTTAISALAAEMASRWGPQRMLDGLVFTSAVGSLGTVASVGAARNSQFVTDLPFRSPLTPPFVAAAAYAGVVMAYGGIDPARPFQTLEVPGIRAPAATARFTRQEREQLLRDGMSTWTVNAGGAVVLERPITSYQTDASGAEDPSYLDLNTLLTLSYLRWSLRVRIAAKYPRHKLGNDGGTYGIGQPIVTPRVLRAETLAWFRDLEDAGLVENVDQFKADLIIERDASDPNRVNALIPPDIINQFRVFAAQIQFRL